MTDQQFETSAEMTPQAIPPPPPIFASPSIPQHKTGRPTEALVIGIIQLCFSGISLISLIFVFIIQRMLHTPSSMTSSDPVTLSLSVIQIVLQLVMGIALLRMAPWARKGAIGLMIFLVIAGIFSSAYSMSKMTGLHDIARGDSIVRASMWGGFVIGILISLAVNGTMIYFLSRPHVVAAFKAKGGS